MASKTIEALRNPPHGTPVNPAEFPGVTDEAVDYIGDVLAAVAALPQVVPLPDIGTDPADAALQLLLGHGSKTPVCG